MAFLGALVYFYITLGVIAISITTLVYISSIRKDCMNHAEETASDVYSSLQFYCGLNEDEKLQFARGIRSEFFEGKSPREFFGFPEIGDDEEDSEPKSIGDMVERYNRGS